MAGLTLMTWCCFFTCAKNEEEEEEEKEEEEDEDEEQAQKVKDKKETKVCTGNMLSFPTSI